MKRFSTSVLFLFSAIFVSVCAFGQNDPGIVSGCFNNSVTFSLSPEPADGAYEPGQTVEICASFQYSQPNANWLHGIQIILPPGWDESSLNPESFNSTCAGGAGNWVWQGSGTLYGDTYGIGYYYLGAGSNWGQSCPGGTFTYCINVTVDPDCGGSGNDLNGDFIFPGFSTTSDNSATGSGGWGGTPPSPNCDNVSTGVIDASINIPTVIIDCCDAEPGESPGTLNICNNGTFDLFDELGPPVDNTGTWEDPNGNPGVGNSYIFDPLTSPPGDYTYSVTGSDGCVSSSTITMEFISLGQYASITRCNSSTFTISGALPPPPFGPFPDPGFTGTWTGPSGVDLPDGIGTFVPGTNPSGIYTYTFLDAGNCPTTLTVPVTVISSGSIPAPANSIDVCLTDPPFTPFDSLAGTPPALSTASWVYETGGGTNFLPGGSGAVVNPANWSNVPPPGAPQPLESGFMWYFAFQGGCFSTDTLFIDVFEPPNTGSFAEVSICISNPPVNLTSLLTGTPDPGLEWQNDVSGAVIPEMLNPSDYSEGDVLVLSYNGGLEGTSCAQSTNLVVNILPADADAGDFNSITVCESDNIICLTDFLNGTPQSTGSWTTPSGVGTNCIFDPSTGASGTYTYTVTTSCDSDIQTLEVTVISQADAGTDGTLAICDNETNVPLSDGLGGTPDAGGDWTLGGAPVGDTVDGNAVNDGDVYTYTVGTGNCQDISTVTIDLQAAPFAGTAPAAAVVFCDTDPIFALVDEFTTPPSATTGSWSGPGGFTGAFLNPATGQSGTYTYTLTTPGCGSDSESIDITIETAPSAGMDATITVCPNVPGATNLLTALGGDPGGTWTAPAGGPTDGTFSPGDPAGDYVYDVASPSGLCTSTATVTVNVPTLPDPGTDGNVTVCESDPAFNLIDELGGTPSLSAQWLDPSNNFFGAPNAVFTPGTDMPGTYTYEAGDGTCPVQTSEVTVTVVNDADAGDNTTITACESLGNVDLIGFLGGTPDAGGSWSVPNPYFLSGQCGTTQNITYTVDNGTCQDVSTLTLTVECIPNAGGNGTLEFCSDDPCFDLSDGLVPPFNAGGDWTDALGNVVPNNQCPNTLGAGGTFTYTVGGIDCAAASATVTVDITEAMSAANIQANCEASQLTYVVQFEIQDGQGPFTISGTEIVGTVPAGAVYTSNPIPAGTNYSFTVTDNSNCADLNVSGVAPICTCPATASFLNGDQTICAGDNAVFEFDVTGSSPFDIVVNDGTADISFNGYTAGSTVTVSPAAATVYTLVSVEDANCQNPAAGSVSVSVDQTPDAGPGVIEELCAQTGDLTLNTILDPGADTGGTFTDAGGAVVSTVPYASASSGIYTYTLGPNACPGDNAAYDLTIYDPIAVSNISTSCNAAQTQYTVTFTMNGGTGNYSVDGTPVAGNTFTSGPLDPLTVINYSFTVSDDGPCTDFTVNGVAPNCTCLATASFLNGNQTICSGDDAVFEFDVTGASPFDIVVNDGTADIAFNGYTSGSTVAVSPSTATVYTLVSVEDANCQNSAAGSVSVSVDQAPDAGPPVNQELCGQVGNLTLSTLLDVGADPGGEFTDAGGNAVTTVPYSAASSGVYTYTLSPNACPGDNAAYDLTIYNPIQVSNVSTSCNAAQTQYTVAFELSGGTSNYLVDGTPVAGNTFISAPLDPLTVLNYSFVVSDDGPCDDVNVTGAAPNCACPATASLTGGAQTICAGETAALNLNLAGDGPWTVTYDASGNAQGPVTLNSGETIDVTPASTTTYTLTSVNDQNCPGSVSGSITVNVDTPANAGADVSEELCGGTGTLPLASLLDAGADGGGDFYDASSNLVSDIPLNAGFSGIYTYEVGGNACADDEAEYDVTIYDPIELNGVSVECNLAQTEYTVSFDISGGTGNYSVTGSINGSLTGNTFTSNLIDGADAYDFTISDDGPCADVSISDSEPDCDCLATGSLTGSTAICAGSSTDIIVNLNGVPPFSITYQNSSDPGNPTTLNNIFNGHAISVSPGTSATYTLTSILDDNCTGTTEGDPVDITVDTPLEVGNENITCDATGDTYTVTFTVTGGVAPINVTNATGTGPVYTSLPVNSGSSYSITVSDSGACPDETISGNHTCPCTTDAGTLTDASYEICTNESATVTTNGNNVLDGNDAFQYVLHDGSATELGNVLLISNDGTFTYDVSLETGTVYYVSAIAGNENIQGNVDLNDPCLSVSNGLEILFYALPTATFAGNLTVCAGSAAELIVNFSGQGPWSFTYELDDNPTGGTVQSTGNSITLPVTEPGTYTISAVTDANCTGSGGSSATVNTFELPTATLGGEPEVCEGSGEGPEVTFTGAAPYTFLYSIDGEEQNEITTSDNPYTIPAFASGEFTLVSMSDSNCEGTVFGSLDVVFVNGPVAELTGGGVVCEGDEAEFEISLTGQAPWTVEYTVDGVPQTPLTSDVPNFTFESGEGGAYAVTTVTDQLCQGFSHDNDASLTVNVTPSAELSASTNLACIGQEVDVNFNFQGTPPFDVTYAINGAETELNGISQNYMLTLSPESAVVAELLFIEDSSTPACTSEETSSLFVQVTDLPNAPVLRDDTICSGAGPVPIGVPSAPGLSYNWEPSTGLSDSKISNPTLERNAAGSSPQKFTYILTASNEDCAVSDTVVITVEPRPQARFRFTPDPVTSEDPRIFFNNTSIATETTLYFWDFGGLGNSTSENPNFRFPEGRDGDYIVTLTAVDPVTGCTSTYTAEVRVRNELLAYVPNAFTPDGDGKNDLWGPVLTNVEETDYRLTIFDRLGNIVFETTEINQKWNGGQMNSGYYLEAGMYIWVIEGREVGAIEDFEMRGHLILLR